MQPEVHLPETPTEALSLLGEHGDDAKVIAGGTAMTILLRSRLLQVPHLIGLDRLEELRYVRLDGDVLRVGAATTLRELCKSELVRRELELLAGAVGLVGNHRVRAAATIGGNLAEADYASDPPPVLIALDARVLLLSARGERTVPVAELLTSFYETCIAPDELLVEVAIPLPAPGTSGVYLKLTTRSVEDRPCVGVAAVVGERWRSVVVGAVAATPLRLAEEVADADELGAAYAAAVEPLSDLRGSADYRRRAIRALVANAVRRAEAGETGAVRV